MLAWLRSRPWSDKAPAGWLDAAPNDEDEALGELLATGLPFLAVADWMQPGTVDWAAVHSEAHARQLSEEERGDNCAAALEAMKALGFKDAASIIKPSDLAAGKVKSRARGLLWLLMRQVRVWASVRVS